MSTPTIRAALDTFQQAANRGTAVYLSPELVQDLRAALKAEPEGEGPSEKDLYDLAAEFDGDPVPAMRRALELWGTGSAPGPGEVGEVAQWLLSMRELAGEHNPEERRQFTRAATLIQQQQAVLATPLAPEVGGGTDHVEQLAAIIRKVDGNHSMGAAALAEAILERYPLAFLVDPPAAAPAPGENLATPPAPEPGEVGELVAWIHNEAIHGPDADEWRRAATLLHQQEAELAALREPVSECPHCGYEGEMVPAPQAGEVEA